MQKQIQRLNQFRSPRMTSELSKPSLPKHRRSSKRPRKKKSVRLSSRQINSASGSFLRKNKSKRQNSKRGAKRKLKLPPTSDSSNLIVIASSVNRTTRGSQTSV